MLETIFSDLRFRLRGLFRRSIVESELDEELRFHFDHAVEKYERSGLSDEEARRRATLSFGGQMRTREDCRQVRGANFLEETWRDVHFAIRVFSKTPGFFLIAAFTLALGIGASTAVFSLVNTILFKPLPYPNASRLVIAWRVAPFGGFFSGSDDFPWSPRELHVLLQTNTVFESIGAFKKDSFNLTGTSIQGARTSGEPQLIEGVRASAGLFPALGVPPQLGRVFTADDDRAGHDKVVVLSNHLWRSIFHADPAIVGSTIDLNGYSYIVTGVMPEGFKFPVQAGIPASLELPKETLLWVPLALPPGVPGGPSEIGVVGLLKSGIGPAQINQDLDRFKQRLAEIIPQGKGWFTRTVPLAEQSSADARRPLLLFSCAVALVLLIACSNVAGLLLNRSLGRSREFAMRAALGAGRGRLIRQLVTESLLLFSAGGAAGILFAQAGLTGVKTYGPSAIPRLQEAGLDIQVLLYTLAVTLVTGLIFGSVPALTATRISLVEVLKKGGQRQAGNGAAPNIRNGLVIAQVALALVLVVAAGLLVRTFEGMLRADGGFRPAHVVTFELPLPVARYSDTGRMAQLYQQLLQSLQSMVGVQSAGFASVVPLGGTPDSSDLRIPDRPLVAGTVEPYSNYSFISPGYFSTVGTPLLRGRDFTAGDTLNSQPVTIINEAMARKYWPGQDPIGKQVGVKTARYPVRLIVGVVADIKHASLRETTAAEMFVPYTQNEIKIWPSMQSMQFAIRASVDPASTANSIRQSIHAVDPELPLANFEPLANLVENSMSAERFSMLLIGAFGVLALILASVGMYGVIFYSVMQRTQEIGVRMAIGAQRGQIFVLILRNATWLAGIGVVLGFAAALATTRLMRGFLYGVEPTDPITFGAVALLLIAAVLIASYIPARRAMQVDPIVALRYE